jgi:septal ring factor EnvC (AmiA/AmiB activator)
MRFCRFDRFVLGWANDHRAQRLPLKRQTGGLSLSYASFMQGKDATMRMVWLMVVAALVLEPATAGWAQDAASLDQVKKNLQDALTQLKAAQDRKSELANENAKLESHITDLQKQIDTYKRASTDDEERTFFLRSRYAAWEEFMKQYPDLLERWKDWLKDGGVKTGTLPAMGDDGDWPFSANG